MLPCNVGNPPVLSVIYEHTDEAFFGEGFVAHAGHKR